MNIYIDESGTFVYAQGPGRWNAVAALVAPESAQPRLDDLVLALQADITGTTGREVKLRDVPDPRYIEFLRDLYQLNAVVFCTATDAGLNPVSEVEDHQQRQVAEVLRHRDKMKYEGGRQGVDLVANQLASLPPQLYVQLFCQIDLMYDVVTRSLPYFAQREPSTLGHFTWRIDRKSSTKTDYEDAFEKLSPPIFQTRSMTEPLMMVRGFDYSHFSRFEFPPDEAPEYLKDEYGIEIEHGYDIQKIIRDDIKSVDSKSSLGIQAADLIVSGVRRCLREGLEATSHFACPLGRLMLRPFQNGPSINVLGFGPDEPVPPGTERLVRAFSNTSRRMMK